MIATKHNKAYTKTLNWMRCRISFSLLRSAVMCLRGSHLIQGTPGPSYSWQEVHWTCTHWRTCWTVNLSFHKFLPIFCDHLFVILFVIWPFISSLRKKMERVSSDVLYVEKVPYTVRYICKLIPDCMGLYGYFFLCVKFPILSLNGSFFFMYQASLYMHPTYALLHPFYIRSPLYVLVLLRVHLV